MRYKSGKPGFQDHLFRNLRIEPPTPERLDRIMARLADFHDERMVDLAARHAAVWRTVDEWYRGRM